MKASTFLVGGAVIGVGAIALASIMAKKNTTEPSADPDADLLQWNGDPSQICYEVPSDLNLNGEVLRDFCGSFADHIVNRSAAFLLYLPDAIRKTFEDLADGDPEKVSETGIENARVSCLKLLIEDGRTHDVIMRWINGDYDVTKITGAELDYMMVVLEDKIPDETLKHIFDKPEFQH